MVIPVAEHRLIKIRKVNRIRLLRQALLASLAAVSINLIGSLTNSWLYTSEVLKYFVFPNISANFEDQLNTPVYLKNATLGPWKFCWEDPITAFFCEEVHYERDDDAADVTSGIQQSTRKAVAFMLLGVLLDSLGFCSCVVCNCRANTYRTLFVSAVLLILSGIANFACIIVYMAAVSKEVGNKIYAASEMDEPLFHYDFGYSFIMINVSFLLTEVAALFSVVVFMAKRDERTFHRFKIRSLLSSALSPRSARKVCGEQETGEKNAESPAGRLSNILSSTQSTLPPTPDSHTKSVIFF